jgi:uncharacterized OB-fold protein
VDATRPEEIQIGMAVKLAFVQRGEGEKAQTYLAFEKEP